VGKGGGGGQSPDSIKSDASIRFIDALCEGEIEGLVNGYQSIYYNRTPLQNPDLTYNWQIGSIAVANGTQTQPYLPGFGEVYSEVNVNQQVKLATGAVVRSIVTPSLDALKVTIYVPRLVSYGSDGGSSGTIVEWKIYLKIDSGLFVLKEEISIDEKASRGFDRQSTIRIPAGGYSTLQLKVERVTADSTSESLANDTVWKSYTEVIEEKFAYPNIALVGTEIASSVLQSGGNNREYYVKGLKVPIPVNGTVDAEGGINYSGSWNGQFTTPVWCADPAWCMYYLLRNDRFGAGIDDTTMVASKWEFYSASQWCNAMMPDGYGGQERRFSLSLIIDSAKEDIGWIQEMATAFNGVFYMLGERIALSIDKPSSPVALITNENAAFNYATAPLRNIVTVVLVEFQDNTNFGEVEIEVVEDRDLVARYGYREKRIKAIGCASRGQAHRFGEWYLISANAEVLTIRQGAIAASYLPGDILTIADRNKTPYQVGRIERCSETIVYLGQEISLSGGYDIILRLSNGTIDRRAIRQQSTTTDYINPIVAYPTKPLADSVWTIVASATVTRQFKIVAAAKENDGYVLSTIEYDPTKYDRIGQNLVLGSPASTSPPNPPNQPRNLSAYLEFAPNPFGISGDILQFEWDYPVFGNQQADTYTAGYEFAYRKQENAYWVTVTGITAKSYEIRNVVPGFWIGRVRAIDIFNRQSAWLETPPLLVGFTNASAQFTHRNNAIFVALTAYA
jgi:predicted phage tail protein